MLNLSDSWRTARVEIRARGFDSETWAVVAEVVTVKPSDRVYDLRRQWAKRERIKLDDVRFIPLLGAE